MSHDQKLRGGGGVTWYGRVWWAPQNIEKFDVFCALDHFKMSWSPVVASQTQHVCGIAEIGTKMVLCCFLFQNQRS